MVFQKYPVPAITKLFGIWLAKDFRLAVYGTAITLIQGCDMHFEILVEDVSGKKFLEIIVPKIIDSTVNTYRIFSYKGIGRIPKNLHKTHDPAKRILLEQLPRLLQGYGKSLNPDDSVVIVVVDCDKRDCQVLKKELISVLDACILKPRTFFRIAIEEMEAWLLGDKEALLAAYPKSNVHEYDYYKPDRVINTWEKLADITLHADSKILKKAPWFEIGKQKIEWAQRIGPHMNVQNNASPSFNCFKQKLEELTGVTLA